MSKIGYRIYDRYERPEKEKIDQFANIPVANIGDSMNRMAALDSRIVPMNQKNIRLMGPAYTVNCPAGDNLLFYYAIDNAKPGDVIVVANNGYTERALCGEIMAHMAEKRKLAGFVVDGAVRDKSMISQMELPVFAVSNSPNGPYKNGPGEVNVPISVGGQVICPGDIVIGDMDGIVVIKPEEADDICEKAKKVMEKEEGMIRRIDEQGGLDLAWMYDKLASDHCEKFS